MIEQGPHYLDMSESGGVWNIIDMSIIYLNMVFLIMLCGDVIKS